MLGKGRLCGLVRASESFLFRSDCGPGAWSAECMAATSQGDQDLGTSGGC